MPARYHDKIIAITGATHGLGAALAEAFFAQDAKLALCDMDEALHERWRDTPNVLTTTVDVSKHAEVQAWAATVDQQFGGCDILINNAGITIAATFEEHRIEDWEKVLGVNLWGPIYGCKAFLPSLKASKGQIVNISSIFGVVSLPGQAAYCTSKYAIRGLSEGLWEELRRDDISVMVVHPGGIATRIVENSSSRNPLWQAHLQKHVVPFFKRRALAPEKAAKLILTGISKRKSRLLIGPEAYLFDAVKRLFPVWGNYWAFKRLHAILRFHELEDENGQLITSTPADVTESQ
jgi:NAD(P)-dependent dehydrogenase (short-subunit alcohol dehydrogenase family)